MENLSELSIIVDFSTIGFKGMKPGPSIPESYFLRLFSGGLLPFYWRYFQKVFEEPFEMYRGHFLNLRAA